MKKIVLTGGGTAGHVTPNIALLPALQAAGYEIAYVGSYEGIEKKLIADFNIPYTGISTGKFRRYLDPKNFSDPFRVMKGFVEARNYLKNYQPDVVFSKGGFVSVPVVRAAASLHIPCIIHESDMTPGLANKLCIPVAEKVCCNFPETMKNIPADKAVLTGSPIRAELAEGSLAHDFPGNNCAVGLKVGHSFRELEAGHELGISFVGQRAATCLLSGNLEPVRDR